MAGDSELVQLQKIGNSGGRNPVQETRYQELMKGQGGMGGIDLSAGVSAAQNNTKSMMDLFGRQRAETGDFLTGYGSAIRGQESSTALNDRLSREMGLPEQRANVQSMQNTLFNLPSTYSAATTGHDVNANQLARIVGTKQAELAPAASLAQSNLQAAEGQLTQRMGFAQQDQQKQLLPFELGANFLQTRLAREASGMSEAMSSELSAILNKMQMGVEVSENEKNRAQQLAIAERGYEEAMKLAKFNVDNREKAAADPFVSLSEGQTLFSTATGKPIYSVPKTYAPKSGGSGDTWS